MADLYAPPRDTPQLGDALVLDCLHSFEEAERVLIVAELGAHELLGAVEREADRLGVGRREGTPIEEVDLTDEQERRLAPLYAQREMARVSIECEHDGVRAFTLIAMFAALDSFVEAAVESFLRFGAETLGNKVREGLGRSTKELIRSSINSLRAAQEAGRIEAEAAKSAKQRLRTLEAGPRGLGWERYEQCLQLVLLGNRGRPVPSDLDAALRSFGAIRNCIVHRRGRADTRLFSDAPVLRERYEPGAVIRIRRRDYGEYSAALWTVAEDLQARVAMAAGAPPDDSLAGWRGNRTINM
jgi:hypothetical protein